MDILPLMDGFESTPAISQGTVYAGSNDKKIYALDIETKISGGVIQQVGAYILTVCG